MGLDLESDGTIGDLVSSPGPNINLIPMFYNRSNNKFEDIGKRGGLSDGDITAANSMT